MPNIDRDALPPLSAAKSNGDLLSLSIALIWAPSDTRYSTISGWSNIAAQCSGVIFWTSHDCKQASFSSGCILNISLTISVAPWAQAKWTGVDRSCCWIDILAPDLKLIIGG